MDDKIKLLQNEVGENRLKTNVKLRDFFPQASLLTAQALYIATTAYELIRIFKLSKELEIKTQVLGLGSKYQWVTDFPGLIIKNRSDQLKVFGLKGKVSRLGLGIQEAFLEADSGNSLARVVDFAQNQGFLDLEELRNIIGSLGGSLKYALPLQKAVYQVKVLDKENKISSKMVEELKAEDLILTVTFKLTIKRKK